VAGVYVVEMPQPLNDRLMATNVMIFFFILSFI